MLTHILPIVIIKMFLSLIRLHCILYKETECIKISKKVKYPK